MVTPVGRMPAMSLAVVGAPYLNADGTDRRFEILLSKPGEPIELRLEPKNKHDPRAVAVISVRGTQIGYLTAERCGRIGDIIRSGREVIGIFQDGDVNGAWIRVAFDGEDPVLTPSMIEERGDVRRSLIADPANQVTDGEPAFYPDEVWPDD